MGRRVEVFCLMIGADGRHPHLNSGFLRCDVGRCGLELILWIAHIS